MTLNRSVERTKVVSNPTTTAAPVNVKNQAWFDMIMRYVELKAYEMCVNARGEHIPEAEWNCLWPKLRAEALRNATKTCVAELDALKLVHPN